MTWRLLLIAIIALQACGSSDSEADSNPSQYEPAAAKSSCDTAEVSYASIAPIVQEKCMLCHNESMKAGDILLGDYSLLVSAVQEHDLQAAINFESPKPMPPTGKLDDCLVAKINHWIKLGMPEK